MKQRISIRLFAFSIALVFALGSLACAHKADPSSDLPVVTISSEEYTTNAPVSEPPVELPTEAPATDIPETEAPETEEPVTEAPTEAPTEPPTAAPTQAPNYVSLGTRSMPARFTMPTDLYGLSRTECEQFFSDAVFCGDSITNDFRHYHYMMLENDPQFFGQTHFLCEGSYGVGHAFDPISSTSMHPIYAGEQHYLWDSIHLMGARKVFILFGLNDIAIYGVDGTAERFEQLTDRILEVNPGVKIYIISTMYMYHLASPRPKLNNPNIYLLNQKLVDLCNRKGYQFLNIASHLIDENGYVPDRYSSDQYVHQTYAAYDVWADILRSLAAREILGKPPVVFSLPQ